MCVFFFWEKKICYEVFNILFRYYSLKFCLKKMNGGWNDYVIERKNMGDKLIEVFGCFCCC